jgi:hypothetical protein
MSRERAANADLEWVERAVFRRHPDPYAWRRELSVSRFDLFIAVTAAGIIAGFTRLPPSEWPVRGEVQSTVASADTGGPFGPALAVRGTSAASHGSIEVYTGVASVTPGQPLPVRVSTTAHAYSLSIAHVEATGLRTVFRSAGLPGHDYRSRITYDPSMHMARAHWPISYAVATGAFAPGVYIVSASTAAGAVGRTIVVIRTPVMSHSAPAFVFPTLTYAAYNTWGGGSLYSWPRGYAVSLDRPYDRSGLSMWWFGDNRLLPWLIATERGLQFTTDYDLSTSPPAIAPSFVIFGRHTEYVALPMRDWLDRHVLEVGDMGIVSLGANALYWQVRITTTRDGAQTIVCYKLRRLDPMLALNPRLVSVRWRESPVRRPEGALMGSQFVGVVGDGHRTTAPFVVTHAMPAELLAGTGWHPGTGLPGLVQGEADGAYPGLAGVRTIMSGRAATPSGVRIRPAMTIWTTPLGTRIFDAGTFNLGRAIGGSLAGVSQASIRRFVTNAIEWVAAATRPRAAQGSSMPWFLRSARIALPSGPASAAANCAVMCDESR